MFVLQLIAEILPRDKEVIGNNLIFFFSTLQFFFFFFFSWIEFIAFAGQERKLNFSMQFPSSKEFPFQTTFKQQVRAMTS